MIINSLLDTDLYKFTMMQVVLHQFPGAQVEYRFKCRNEGIALAPYVDEINDEILHLCSLRFRERELEYMRGLRFIKSDFVDFLALFQMNPKYISVSASKSKPGEIDIVVRGPLAAYDHVRDSGAVDRQRDLLPEYSEIARLSGRPAQA